MIDILEDLMQRAKEREDEDLSLKSQLFAERLNTAILYQKLSSAEGLALLQMVKLQKDFNQTLQQILKDM